jgi:hypothetical protein
MKLLLYSDPVQKGTSYNNDNGNNKIHLFYQYYLSPNVQRHREIQDTLRRNILNKHVYKIHLLNETLYDTLELNHDKVVQTCIHGRLTFEDVFEYIRLNNIKGYLILMNADIFFDDTLTQLYSSDLHIQKKKNGDEKRAIAQLRYEFTGNPNTSKIFGPRPDSQDTWIFHSNNCIDQNHEKAFNFPFGIPGCDNKMIYLLKILGFTLFNDPAFLKTYHNHASNIRANHAMIPLPWGYLAPSHYPRTTEIDRQTICFDDNTLLRNYIESKIQNNNNTPFIIPRIAGIENNIAIVVSTVRPSNYSAINEYCQTLLPQMNRNAGVHFRDFSSIVEYSKLYLDAFASSEMYCTWELHGLVYHPSHDELSRKFPTKRHVWASTLDIFHYIYSNPWTHSLRGKRILIVSSLISSMQDQLPHLREIYGGVDLFPDCTFCFIKPPMTQADEVSDDFQQELSVFYQNLDKEKDNYDIALVSSGGNGNIICNYIYKNHQKSAIYVGGVLQMYFGILGNRWIRDRPDVLKLFHNSFWTKPKEIERPKGFYKIEDSCYW